MLIQTDIENNDEYCNDDVIEDEEHYYSTNFVEKKRISKRRNDSFIR
jgi:hypothetical protein